MGSEPTNLGFGRAFTAHMVVAEFDTASGWSHPAVVPFEDLRISPAAMVFHYGQAIFEGLKAYRHPGGEVALFRPDRNAARFNRSAARLAMPPLPEGLFVDACRALVRADGEQVPSGPGESLYLRPLMIATEPGLGVRPATRHQFIVMASPVGAYFAGGVHPITVWVTDDYTRAAPGGTGAAKCAGNYAASLAAKAEATAHGCDETLFLDAQTHRFVEELGGMNLVLVAGGETPTLVAPAIQDTILDGVTRESLLELARHLGYAVTERRVDIAEVFGGSFVEAFACGTAAVVAPIGDVRSRTASYTFGAAGEITMRLRDELVALQEGRAKDGFGWLHPVTPAEREPALRA